MARASPALNGFGHIFSCRNSVGAFKPAFASADVVGCPYPNWIQRLKYQGLRRPASVTASPHLRDNSVDDADSDVNIKRKRGLPLEVEDLISSSRGSTPGPWASAIEQYLPLNLRLQDKNVGKSLRPIHTLPEVLSLARLSCQSDLLSYIGVYQKRWEAVIWLVKAMMKEYPGQKEVVTTSSQLPPVLWETVNQSLDEVTNRAIEFEMPQPSQILRKHSGWPGSGNFSLSQFPSLYNPDHVDDPHILGRKSLGQIWQSLGTMILQAADRPAEEPSYSTVMTHVFRILGYLHRISALPDSIYNYTPATDPTVLQRPPTLYMLSKHIMSTLSDVEWEIQAEETVAQALSEGYELPKASVQLQYRKLGPEVWLDLVLWACVEGGWVSEGACIVMEIQRRRASKDTRWSTISWPEIQKKTPKLGWTSNLKFELEKTRLNHTGGIAIATGSNSDIVIGSRTVSREVVLALLDGLLNKPHSTAEGCSMTTVELRRSVIACKSLLDSNHPELDGNFMDAVILRILETFEDVKEQPALLSRFLALRSTELRQTARNCGTTSSAHNYEVDDSAAILGLLHRNLYHSSNNGDQEGSLQIFRKIQSTVDAQREGKILAFAHKLKERLIRGDDASELVGDTESSMASVQTLQIPLSALSSFIDLITDSRLFSLGNWLLLNEDIDGGFMDPAFYADQNLQPALLRFGAATSNPHLLRKVLLALEMPLSGPIVHALLRFQAALGNWTAVEELLEHLKHESDMAWMPSDATAIVKAILQMEHKSPDNADATSLEQALSIIQDLVNGKYNSKRDPSQLPDLSQTRMANQLGRILQTLPGSLSKITVRFSGKDLRAHASVDITPHAFNIIVRTVADLYGSVAGKKLWDQWCGVPSVPKRERRLSQSFGDGEGRVTPTLYTLRSILRPALETRRALHGAMKDELIKAQTSKTTMATIREYRSSVALDRKYRLGAEDAQILSWGVGMFKKFGLSESEINNEIPGSFPQSQRNKRPDTVDGDDVDSESDGRI